MCVIFIAVGKHPRYPLIVAANRDERHDRPSEPMHYWRDQPGILAGRDRQGGGTWFGVNARGRMAAVANRHTGEAHEPAARSRGELTARFLRNEESLEDYAEFVRRHQREFNPFNLLYGDLGRLYRISSGEDAPRLLERGFHSISNGAPHDRWPKMSRGLALLKDAISSSSSSSSTGALDGEQLARMMRDESAPAAATATAPQDKRRAAIFIRGADYGTRATTLLFGAPDRFALHEYNYAANGGESARRRYSLAIQPPAADKG